MFECHHLFLESVSRGLEGLGGKAHVRVDHDRELDGGGSERPGMNDACNDQEEGSFALFVNIDATSFELKCTLPSIVSVTDANLANLDYRDRRT